MTIFYLNIAAIFFVVITGEYSSNKTSSDECIIPPQPQFGSFKYGASLEKPVSGQKVTEFTFLRFECDTGYILNSYGVTFCLGGEWINKIPTCFKPKLCKPPWSPYLEFSYFYNDSSISSQKHSLPSYVPGTIMVPKCREYFKTSTILNNATCKEDGTWDDGTDDDVSEIECEPEFCYPLYSDMLTYLYSFNGRDVDPDDEFIEHGTNATVRCQEEKYKTVGIESDVITCLPDGEWTESLVECRAIFCTILWSNSMRYDVLSTGEELTVYHPRNPGTVVRVSCKENFKASGIENETITCLEDATWQKPSLHCLPEFCSPLELYIKEYTCYNNETEVDCKNKMKIGTIAKIKCPENLTRSGPDQIRCQDDGKWDDVEITCNEEIVNEIVDDHKTTSGECKYGYFPLEIPNMQTQCIPEYCEALLSDTYKFTCFREQVEVNCREPLLVGTSAIVECQDNLQHVGLASENMTCEHDRNRWSEPNLICTKGTCNPLFSTSLNFVCYFQDKELDCEQELPYGAVAVTECKEHYLPKEAAVGNITCKDSGFWNIPDVKCIPECAGKTSYDAVSTPGIEPYSTLQYVAAIYENITHDEPTQRGTGTIVSAKFVITNALSFWTFGARLNLTFFTIGYGLKHNKWHHPLNHAAKYSPVKRLVFHPKFIGHFMKHSHNVAVVELLHVIQFNAFVKPACIQWKEALNHQIAIPNTKGEMPNWKIIKPSDIPNDELRTTVISTISTDECEKIIKGEVNMKDNMFCGEIINGSICVGDIGAGLVVLDNYQDRTVYVLKAMFSHVPIIDETTFCSLNQIAFFSKLSDHTPWLREQKIHIEPTEFKCKSGEIVIASAVCDEVEDCIDGSDEILNSCIYKDITNLESKVGKGNGSCIAPPQLRNGRYSLFNTGLVPEVGAVIDINEKIIFKCDEGFELSKKDDSLCTNGEWVPTIPRCLKTCEPLKSKHVQYSCYVNSTTERSCEERVPAGTVAFIRCNLHYKPLKDIESFICDENGSWGRTDFACVPECGKLSNDATSLIIEGTDAEIGETPWNVAIYKNIDEWSHICGGSLINVNIILSAAHCFWDFNKQTGLKRDLFAVGLGKVWKAWHHPDDKYAVYRKVKKLTLHPEYKGIKSKYAFDLAIITLANLLEYSVVIKPVCVEWNHKGFAQKIPKDVVGKVVGWGQTEFGVPSNRLKEVSLPAVLRPECKEKSSKSFSDFITFDKICAGYLDGSNVCKGDSGAGLCFPQERNGETLYYLRGIVSITDIHEKTCNANLYAAYTDVLSHLTWMHSYNVTKEPDVFRCSSGEKISNEFVCDNEPDCSDESDEDDELCIKNILALFNSAK